MNDTTPLTLAEAADHFPICGGRKIHVKTIKRRIIKGVRGVKLNAFKDGHRWYTTRQWIREFQEACTRQAMPNGQRTQAQRSAAHRRAKELLKRRYGFNATENDQTEETGTEEGSRPQMPNVRETAC